MGKLDSKSICGIPQNEETEALSLLWTIQSRTNIITQKRRQEIDAQFEKFKASKSRCNQNQQRAAVAA
jgi:hypothetical protein